jgi:hypothetical protein
MVGESASARSEARTKVVRLWVHAAAYRSILPASGACHARSESAALSVHILAGRAGRTGAVWGKTWGRLMCTGAKRYESSAGRMPGKSLSP